MSLETILATIGHFFANLFKSAEIHFEDLPQDQQQAIINGSAIPQIIKENLEIGETQLTGLIIQKTNLPADVVNGLLSKLYSGFNVSTLAEYQAILKAASGSLWSGILETSAKILGIALSGGSITWESLGLGLLQVAYQKYVKDN